MSFRSFLAVSLLAHALIVVWFACSPSVPVEKKKLWTPQALEFELKSVSSNPLAQDVKLGAASKSIARPKPKLAALLKVPYNSARPRDTSPDIKTGGEAADSSQTARSGAWSEADYGPKDDPTVAWGAGSGTFQRIQDLSLMTRFQQKIDAVLFYPGILARRQMSGVVNSRIVLNSEGSCDWHRTRIESANPYFRVYILHLLKGVCSENFKKYTRDRELTNVDMSFTFEISEDLTSAELIAQNQKVLGNVLLFYRHSRHSVAEWHLGPLKDLHSTDNDTIAPL